MRLAIDEVLHDFAVGFSRRAFGQDPNSRDDGDAVTAVRVEHEAQRGRTAGADQSADALAGGAGGVVAAGCSVDVVDDEDEAADEAR